MQKVLIITLVILFCALGCSGSNQGPTTPAEETQKISNSISTHALWGLWQWTIDPEMQTIEIAHLREAGMHVNVLPFLEPPALVNLTLDSIQWNGNIIEADIGLRHPFLGLTEFTGFDVCGVFISNGSNSGFDDEDIVMAGDGDTRLLNPDGYSRWWNPAEFPVNLGTILSYNDGLLGTPDSYADYSSTLNGYKYYCDDLDADDPIENVILAGRGMFTPGQKNVRHYTIQLGTGGLIFNYAIDACWLFPQGGPPWTAPDDFSPGANRVEAWRIDVDETTNTLWNDGSGNGGNLSLSIDVYDWFNPEANTIKVESPGNFDPVISIAPVGGGTGFSTYEVEITDATPAEDSIDLLISAESGVVGYGGLLPGKPITAYFTRSVAVSSEPPLTNGWAQTWGDTGPDRGYGVTTDTGGNSYVTGFTEVSSDNEDIFLRKYDTTGALQWDKTWGGSEDDQGVAVDVDGAGYVYVTGAFRGNVDFDPDSGVDNHVSNGGPDIFLSKFDSTGSFIWARTWGGTVDWDDIGYGIAVDGEGGIYVTGSFFGDNVDFDPGPGTDNHSSVLRDIFLTKFDSSGDFLWAGTWGGESNDGWYGDVDVDNTDGVLVAGYYRGTCDFDPGLGTYIQTSVQYRDIFLSKFNYAGDFQWARVWGGTSTFDEGYGVAVDSMGNSYVTGRWEDTIDFDPDPVDEELKTANGHFDVFVSKFDTDGDFKWVLVWGGTSYEICNGIAVDGNDNIYIAGYWRGTDVDFDPGTGVDPHSSTEDSGGYPTVDIFLCKYDSSGDYVWARTWGGESRDEGHAVVADAIGSSWIAGSFYGSFDFAPGDPPCNEPPDNHASNGSHDAFLSKHLPDGCW